MTGVTAARPPARGAGGRTAPGGRGGGAEDETGACPAGSAPCGAQAQARGPGRHRCGRGRGCRRAVRHLPPCLVIGCWCLSLPGRQSRARAARSGVRPGREHRWTGQPVAVPGQERAAVLPGRVDLPAVLEPDHRPGKARRPAQGGRHRPGDLGHWRPGRADRPEGSRHGPDHPGAVRPQSHRLAGLPRHPVHDDGRSRRAHFHPRRPGREDPLACRLRRPAEVHHVPAYGGAAGRRQGREHPS